VRRKNNVELELIIKLVTMMRKLLLQHFASCQ